MMMGRGEVSLPSEKLIIQSVYFCYFSQHYCSQSSDLCQIFREYSPWCTHIRPVWIFEIAFSVPKIFKILVFLTVHPYLVTSILNKKQVAFLTSRSELYFRHLTIFKWQIKSFLLFYSAHKRIQAFLFYCTKAQNFSVWKAGMS